MPGRLRLYDFRNSRGATTAGLCQGDLARVAEVVNTIQERLVYAKEAGDTGWWGSWMWMAFNVAQDDPYLTTPRGVARLMRMSVCKRAVNIQNQFYEYLDFGIGLQPYPDCFAPAPCGQYLETYERNNAVTFLDLDPPGKKIRVYITDAADSLKRVLIQGKDSNGNQIYTLDGLTQVQGVFLELGSPFVDTEMEISELTGIQKDITFGQVQFYEVDVATGDQRLLLTMEPGEEVSGYRRYFLNGLPKSCCNPEEEGETVQVTALAKLELLPVKVDTDYLLIQSLQALIEEGQSIRYSEVDNMESKRMAQEKHMQAIRLLQGQLVHYLGKDRPAVEVKPFGSASLARQRIGTLI